MRYYLIAGEASGDLHGSNLMKGLKQEDPGAQFRFRGGDMMAAVGGTLVYHYKEGAVMGVSDVIMKSRQLADNLKACREDILKWDPDVVILIDYPGFNFRIARFAHEKGIKVYWYIAPKTWASRQGRNRKLKAWVDKLFIVFPFEKDYFASKGIPYVYKGNPLVDAVDSHEYKRPCEGPYIAILAGSRKGEMDRMMPVCMQMADRYPDRHFIIAGAPAREYLDYAAHMEGRPNVELMFDRTYDILKYADCAVINSGTASLEAALIGTPQVVCWSTSGLTYFVASKLLRVVQRIKYISLANLILDKFIFKELIQGDFNVDKLCAEVGRLCGDGACRAQMTADYAAVREALGGAGASRAVARAMVGSLRRVGAGIEN